MGEGVRKQAGGAFSFGAALLFGTAIASGGLAACQGRAGMFCEKNTDCRVGLTCVKPTTGSPAELVYGVCEPARRGLGETCLVSAECTPGLRCSNEIGVYSTDDRHGTCENLPDAASPVGVDMAIADLSTVG